MKPGARTLVVGGGIAGIVAALRASELGQRVTLIEKQAALGGLLSSWQPEGEGHWFDCGTHLPADTGNAELDRMLFGWFGQDEWQRLPVVRAANYWNGRLNGVSPCLDLRTLPEERYRAVLPGLLRRAAPAVGGATTLAQQVTELYGAEMLRWVFDPVLRKFYGLPASELAPDAHLLFGLIRFICLDPEQARASKQDAILDRKLAFHSYHETPAGAPLAQAYYPRVGGVGRWVEGLERQLAQAGVELRTKTCVTHLDVARGQAGLSSGARTEFDRIIWCSPPAMLLRLTGHPELATLPAPALSTINLYHYVVDAKTSTDAHYVTCYEPGLQTFRVTLYGNLQPEATGPARITVEVLRTSSRDPQPTPESIFSELKQMGLVAADTSFSACHLREIPGAFPIQSVAHRQASRRAAELVARDHPSVRLLGRASGAAFFMRDVLRDAWAAAIEEPAAALA